VRNRLELPEELANYFFHVTLVAVYCVVQLSHLLVRDLSGQTVDRIAQRRISIKRLGTNDRRRFIRREVVTIIFKLKQAKLVDQSISRVARDQVDLASSQRAVSEREIH